MHKSEDSTDHKNCQDEKNGGSDFGGDVFKFEKINRIGEGTYGVVYRAKDKLTGEIVALKKVRMDRERDGMPVTALRELRILQMCHHPNIVNLKQVVTGTKVNSIFLVFEYVEHDVARLVDNMRSPFTEAEIKCLILQLLEAVAFLHEHCVTHRDLKLSNLLLNNRGRLKLCDFGLARFFKPHSLGPYTPRVVTLWYRAPELLLGAVDYSCAVDMWALGCILGELLLNEPLFPGKTEIQMLELVSRRIGSPNQRIWPGLAHLPHSQLLKLPTQPYNQLKSQFPHLAPEGLDLLNALLTYDPNKRITASEALRHPYWKCPPLPKPQAAMPTHPTAHDPHLLPCAPHHHAPHTTRDQSSSLLAKRRIPAGAPPERAEAAHADRFGSIFGSASGNQTIKKWEEHAKPGIRIKRPRSK